MDDVVKTCPFSSLETVKTVERPSRDEAEAAVRTLLRWAGDDPDREGLLDTPRRVVKAYEEFFSGYRESADEVLSKVFEEVEGYDDLVLVRDIPFTSHCEHHVVPFVGKTHIAYYPAGGVVGLSKLARLVEIFPAASENSGGDDGKETLIDYDARFRKPTRIQNALNNVTTMVYDVKGNLTSLTNAENETTTFTYTPKGQLATVVDPLTRTASFTYDGEGNLLTSTNTALEVVTQSYDAANRLFLLTDSLNRVTQFTYDSLDRVQEVRDAIGGLTRYAYDANDNLTSATDARNNPVERNVYDLRNRLKTRTDAKNKNTTYVYDGVGNLTQMTDRKGQVSTYTYDALNRVTQVQDQDGRTTSYTYDLAGNLARITDSQSGEMLMSYDVLDRLTEVVTAQGTVQYGYDAIGRRTSRTLSGGDVTTYTYDKVNRLKTVTLRNRTATYNYDLGGRLTEKILPNGLKTTYQYDAADRVTSIAYTKPDNTVVESVAYTYDAGGQTNHQDRRPAGASRHHLQRHLRRVQPPDEDHHRGRTLHARLRRQRQPHHEDRPGLGHHHLRLERPQPVDLPVQPCRLGQLQVRCNGLRIEKTVSGQTTGFLYDGAQAIAELRGVTDRHKGAGDDRRNGASSG